MSDAATLRFIGGPLDDFDDAAPLFEAIGFASASWARLETQIDALLVHINKPAYAAELYQPDHPISFSRKIKLLKRWFNRHKALSPYRDRMRVITSRLKDLGEDRNLLIHAIFEGYDAERQTATVRTFKYQGNDRFTITQLEIDLRNFAKFAATVNYANRELWSISEALFTEDGCRLLETP